MLGEGTAFGVDVPVCGGIGEALCKRIGEALCGKIGETLGVNGDVGEALGEAFGEALGESAALGEGVNVCGGIGGAPVYVYGAARY